MYIKVRVRADSKVEQLEKVKEDHFEVRVKEKAEMNQANRRVLELFKAYFKTNNVRLVSGHHSPSKILNIGE